jgi:2-amino-4-hydroxy-6-hydroxymethyldihydropteridine diphosphokinase
MIGPVGIALGSNLGDRAAELDAGIFFLRDLSVDDKVRESPRLETVPVDCPPGSPPFLNAVAEIRIDTDILPPRALLEKLQAFERERGRAIVRAINAPRPLDLDIIYYACVENREQDLIIPHPRAHLRRFVLEPLSHMRPDLVLPGQTKSVSELLAELRD